MLPATPSSLYVIQYIVFTNTEKQTFGLQLKKVSTSQTVPLRQTQDILNLPFLTFVRHNAGW